MALFQENRARFHSLFAILIDVLHCVKSVPACTETALDRLTLGSILRTFLPVLLHLLKLGAHKLRVLWQHTIKII